MLGSPWLGQVPLARSYRPRRRFLGTGVTDDNSGQVLSAPLAIVDFWSSTCVPCMKYKPVFEDVSSSPPGGILMVTANVDENPSLVSQFNIQSIPTTLFLQSGQEMNRLEGILSKNDLLSAIASTFPQAAAQAAPVSAPAQAAPVPAPVPTSPAPAPAPPSSTVVAPAPARAPSSPATPLAPAAPGAPAKAPEIPTAAWIVGGISIAVIAGVLLSRKF